MQSRITLHKIKLVKSRSFETACFSAVVCLDGVPIAHVDNDGRGGANRYYPVQGKTNADFLRLEEVAKLTKHVFFSHLECVICDLLDQYEKEQFHAKQLKKTEFCIVGQKDNEYITNQPFSKKIPIETLMKDVFYRKYVQKRAYEIEQKGWKILNTNIPR